MIIDPQKISTKDRYKIMVGSIVPRPIAFVSTIATDGTRNLAPFSYFMAISADPPTLCFAPGRRAGKPKDTQSNVEATGEFVVNVVTEEMGPGMNLTAGNYPAGTDEFEEAGFTPEPSRVVQPPRVKESPISMECKLHQVVPIGGPTSGASLVIGEIVMFHVADELYNDGRIDIRTLKPLGRLAGTEYTTLGKIVSLEKEPHQPKGS